MGMMAGLSPRRWRVREKPKLIVEFKYWAQTASKVEATRFASGYMPDRPVPAIPTLLGGSADLTPAIKSTNSGRSGVEAQAFKGGYLHFGASERGIAAIMNG